MKLSQNLFVIAAIATLSNAAYANTTKPTYDSSVLLPGARIVAGDLSKNEFFILAGNDESKAKMAAKQVMNPSQDQLKDQPQKAEIIPKIKMSLNQTAHSDVINPAKKTMPTLETTASNTNKIENKTVALPKKTVTVLVKPVKSYPTPKILHTRKTIVSRHSLSKNLHTDANKKITVSKKVMARKKNITKVKVANHHITTHKLAYKTHNAQHAVAMNKSIHKSKLAARKALLRKNIALKWTQDRKIS